MKAGDSGALALLDTAALCPLFRCLNRFTNFLHAFLLLSLVFPGNLYSHYTVAAAPVSAHISNFFEPQQACDTLFSYSRWLLLMLSA